MRALITCDDFLSCVKLDDRDKVYLTSICISCAIHDNNTQEARKGEVLTLTAPHSSRSACPADRVVSPPLLAHCLHYLSSCAADFLRLSLRSLVVFASPRQDWGMVFRNADLEDLGSSGGRSATRLRDRGLIRRSRPRRRVDSLRSGRWRS